MTPREEARQLRDEWQRAQDKRRAQQERVAKSDKWLEVVMRLRELLFHDGERWCVRGLEGRSWKSRASAYRAARDAGLYVGWRAQS